VFSGSLFFNENVNADRYLHMLQNNFLPQLSATQMPPDTKWFVQEGATTHAANEVLDFQHKTLRTYHLTPL
jgi:hypothetical protein